VTARLDYARRFMQIRMARESDAEGLLRLLGRLDHETRFMMYEPEEMTTTEVQIRDTRTCQMITRDQCLAPPEHGAR
jgi:N-acetylglutamate synthase-like GNAT family acetyltransferase